MLNKIVWTFASRVFTALLNFFVVYITAKDYGAEGRGLISIVILSISVIGMISSLAGGPSLIYLASRHSLIHLVLPSYIWGITTAVAFSFLFYVTGLIPENYLALTLVISILSNLSAVHFNMLIGKEKIHAGNLVTVIHVFILALALWLFPFLTGEKNVNSFFYAYAMGLTLALLFGGYRIFTGTSTVNTGNFTDAIKTMFRYGFLNQVGNLMQLLNYRLSFYLLVLYMGDNKPLGVYATAVAISEAVWLISSSFSTVQYARISNSNDRAYSGKLTLALGKLSLWFSLAGLLLLSLVPDTLYTRIFGNEFTGMSHLILLLSPGIAIFSLCALLSHYFAGTGRIRFNTFASGIGFIITLIAAPWLIKNYTVTGAIITANISYFATTICLIILFVKERGISVFQLLIPGRRDIDYMINEIRNYVRDNRNR